MNGCRWRSLLVLTCLLWLPMGASAADGYVVVIGLGDVAGATSYNGIALIVVGFALLVAEAFLPSFGVIGLGGVVAFTAGAILLMNTNILGFTVELPTVFSVAVIGMVCLVCLVGATLKSRQRKVVSGDAGLVGSSATITKVQTDDPLGGWVQLQGEHWQVVSQAPLRTGQRVQVVARRGVMLEVAPVPDTPQLGD